MVLPKICKLSGRSRDGMLLDVDLPEDFLDRLLMPSSAFSHEGRSPDVSDRRDDDPDELAWWLRCLSRTDDLFNRLLSARRLSGEGGPSTAGSSRSGISAESLLFPGSGWEGDDVLAAFLDDLVLPVDLDFFVGLVRGLSSTLYRDEGGTAHIFMIKRGLRDGALLNRV